MNLDVPLLSQDRPPAQPPQPEPASPAGDRQSLYRAYRSLTFGEVAGQAHVTKTLRNAVMYGSVAHAYLFTGPRGTGKTSTARILARAANCLQPRQGEPCNVCAICVSMLERRSLDLIEIDGASNNSVDDVRELRDRVNFRPTEARRKVFIIDEVHMLSIGAFNALLKTLEEPPEHVLFVLATTEVHKVPATVSSRCQRFDLRPIPVPEMVERLRYVCEHERMSADEETLRFVAAQSTGSLRDALSLLEQIRAYCGDTLYLQDVEVALGLARTGQVAALADSMAAGDLAAALLAVGELIENGIDPRQLSRQLTGYWRDALEGRARGHLVLEPHVAPLRADQIVPVLRSLLSVESSTRRSDSPRWALELAVAEASLTFAGGGDLPAVVGSSGRSPQRVASSEQQPSPVRALSPSRAPGVARPEPEATGASEPILSESAAVPDSLLPRDGDGVWPLDEADEARPAGAVLSGGATTDTDAGSLAARSDARLAPPAEVGTRADDEPMPGSGRAAEITAPTSLPAPVEQPGEAVVRLDTSQVRERWPAVLRWLLEHDRKNIHGYLNATTAQGISVEDSTIKIGFPSTSEFIRKQFDRPNNRVSLEGAIDAVLGGRWTVRCVTITGLTPPPSAEEFELFALDAEQALRDRKRRTTGES